MSFRKKFRRPIAFQIAEWFYRHLGYETALIMEINLPYPFGSGEPLYLILECTKRPES